MSNPFKTRQSKYYKIPRELFNLPNLSNSAFRLYAYICTWDRCYASYKDIKEATGMAKGTIAKALAELVDNNMLEYKQGHSIGRNVANQYILKDSPNWKVKPHDSSPKTEPDRSETRPAQVQKLDTINANNTDNQYSPEIKQVQNIDLNNKQVNKLPVFKVKKKV
jgi:hypothetical protein